MKIIYARQSVDKKDSISIESQIEKCIALCTYNGWDYKIYKDSGYSGKNMKRPGFMSLMDEIHSGNADTLICYRLDRISRSMADFSNFIVELEQYGTKFISTTENFDSTTPLGRAMVNIIMTFAQLERETIVGRVTDNYYSRTKLGHWGGGVAPYGYDLKKTAGPDGKHFTMLEINSFEADTVRKMYEWYLEYDGSVSKIIDKLNSLNIPSRGGNYGAAVWTSRVVSEILWRPLYAPNDSKIYNYFRNMNANFVNEIEEFDGSKSVNLFGKTIKNDSKHKRCRKVSTQYFAISPHIPIIDSETWLKVQAKKASKRCKPARLGTGKNSVFTGLIKCGECGYSVSSTGDSKNYKGYMCSSRKNRGNNACSLPIMSHRQINPIIFTDIIEHFSSDEIRLKINNAKQEQLVSPEYLSKKNSIELNIVKLDAEIDNLLSSIASGSAIVNKYINDKISGLDSTKNALYDELHEVESIEYQNRNSADNFNDILQYIDRIEEVLNNDNFDEVKEMCHTFIRSITLYKDKSIEIDYYV